MINGGTSNKNMGDITRNQHYVWRAYLRPWCDCKNEKNGVYFIWWNNKKVCKDVDVCSILRDKDFYKLCPLNRLELFLLENMFAKANQKGIKKANETIVNLARLISNIDQIIQFSDREFNNEQIQSGETIQSTIEKMGIEAIGKLRNFDISWLDDEEKRCDFLLFLCVQYLRTKSMKDRQLAVLEGQSDLTIELFKKEFNDNNKYTIDWAKIYNYGHICLAHKFAYALLARGMKFKLVKSKNIRFIVSDQPVYNMGDSKNNELTLFYPIEPYLALIGSIEYQRNELVEIEDNEVLAYNLITLKHTHNFFMGKEKADVDFSYPY